MTEEEAQRVLQNVDVVQVLVSSMQDIKRKHLQCLDADIPALMKRPAGKGGG